MTDLRKIQQIQEQFISARKWDGFSGAQIFTHLIEELGEIASFLLYKEKYKIRGAGHNDSKKSIESEFAQSFSLFLHLAIIAKVDLESCWLDEIEVMHRRFDVDTWLEIAEKKKKS